MEETVSAETDRMNQGTGTQTDGSTNGEFRSDFYINGDLPTSLSALGPISMNFAWSWLPGGVELFRDLAPRLWDECEQNPRLLLKRLSDLTLTQWAADESYVRRLNEFSDRLSSYLQPPATAGGSDPAHSDT